MQVQQVVGRTLGIGVAAGVLLGIGALPASAAPAPPVRPGEVQIGEPLVIERDPPVSTDALSPSPEADSDGSETTRLTAAVVVVGALVLGASGRRRWA